MTQAHTPAAADQSPVTMAFPTPIVRYVWPDSAAMNDGLRARILEMESKGGGVQRSNIGAWHSDTDLLRWDDDSVRALAQRMVRLSTEFTGIVMGHKEPSVPINCMLEAWANVARDGDYMAMHDHPMAHWSGVYYVSVGEPTPGVKANGKLQLFDPRVGVNMLKVEHSMFDHQFLVDPAPGLMVLFPSWLKHMVHPFRGTGERISISFNATLSWAKK